MSSETVMGAGVSGGGPYWFRGGSVCARRQLRAVSDRKRETVFMSCGSCVPAADIRLPAKTAVIAGGFLNWRGRQGLLVDGSGLGDKFFPCVLNDINI